MKVLAVVALAAAAAGLEMDASVTRAFSSQERVDVFLEFPYVVPTFIQSVMTRAEKRQATYDFLNDLAEKNQGRLSQYLLANNFEIKRFWINNSLFVRQVSKAALDEIASIFGNEIQRISVDDETMRIPEPIVHEVSEFRSANATEWGLLKINVEEAWALTLGEGVTIAGVDTGVRFTHEALKGSYRGRLVGNIFNHDYNWFDPRSACDAPCDQNGHGTHTMGTIAGTNGIGVAPGAKWIAAKGCAGSSCSSSDLLSSLEWTICPTRVDGTGRDCSKGADAVSNSWGGGRGSTQYLNVLMSMRSAGIIPLFSQGNSGPSCSTANSPGDLEIVIGVGSTTSADQLSSFSSRGPGIGSNNFPLMKPDISAPGSNVRSAYYTSDTAYASLSGTSMACPHVAGLVGLILSANPSLNYEAVKNILEYTSEKSLSVPQGGAETCSGINYNVYPNYHYGNGRIDAAKAVRVSASKKI